MGPIVRWNVHILRVALLVAHDFSVLLRVPDGKDPLIVYSDLILNLPFNLVKTRCIDTSRNTQTSDLADEHFPNLHFTPLAIKFSSYCWYSRLQIIISNCVYWYFLVTGDVNFDVVSLPQSTVKLVRVKLALITTLQQTLNPSLRPFPRVEWIKRLKEIVSGQLIYPL